MAASRAVPGVVPSHGRVYCGRGVARRRAEWRAGAALGVGGPSGVPAWCSVSAGPSGVPAWCSMAAGPSGVPACCSVSAEPSGVGPVAVLPRFSVGFRRESAAARGGCGTVRGGVCLGRCASRRGGGLLATPAWPWPELRPRGSAAQGARPGRGAGHAGTRGAGSKHLRRSPRRHGTPVRRATPSGAGCPGAQQGGATATRKRTCVLPYVVRRTYAGVCKTTCRRGYTCSVWPWWVPLAEWDCSVRLGPSGCRCASLAKRPQNAGISCRHLVECGRCGRCAGEGPAP